MKIVDARGETCPVPVIMLKNALKDNKGDHIKEIVDNEIAKQNLEKMLGELNIPFQSYADGGDFVVEVNLTASDAALPAQTKTTDDVIVLSSEEMGRGSGELGKILMKNFLYALTESDDLPSTILMYNSGVKLASMNTETIEDLKKLEQRGVSILACGLCLNYFGLQDKLQVGSVTNMYIILQTKLSAKKLIQI